MKVLYPLLSHSSFAVTVDPCRSSERLDIFMKMDDIDDVIRRKVFLHINDSTESGRLTPQTSPTCDSPLLKFVKNSSFVSVTTFFTFFFRCCCCSRNAEASGGLARGINLYTLSASDDVFHLCCYPLIVSIPEHIIFWMFTCWKIMDVFLTFFFFFSFSVLVTVDSKLLQTFADWVVFLANIGQIISVVIKTSKHC